ncbi:MAG: hypothetical protein KAS72_05570 [Phycisphaerales bacterium]|nr:hypothetical protein [Phycisphaerales bacterium]
MEPWNNWYHCTGNTYGTWLPGDPRGWRARHHRLHVEGDYKNPPTPGEHAALHERSRSKLTRQPVYLGSRAQAIACDAIVEKLSEKAVEIGAVAVDDHHLHVVGRFMDRNPRRWIGLAKKNSAWAVREADLAPRGGIWAVRAQCLPIADEVHWRTAVAYVLRHGERGAAVWSPDHA